MRSTLFIKSIFLLVLLSGAARAADSYMNQSNVVPLTTAGWLFAFAVIGFVAVANRKKI
ncbi:EPS-associated small membrane protein EppA [Pseudomonas sp. NPDC089396]|uniref:EPS-associated small membrane protein EppA n=1 Tax=Pseudomonas sp. NPDC089396 TaxID=3364461 RepID=UPI003837E2FB